MPDSRPRQVRKDPAYWVTVPFGETVNANPGSSPFPGVVVF
jgi:hypothetical protein